VHCIGVQTTQNAILFPKEYLFLGRVLDGVNKNQNHTQIHLKTKEKLIRHDHNRDGLDRRGFLECMAWAGTGMLWTVSGGLLGSAALPLRARASEISKATFSFVQISDSHIGFSKEGINADVTGTLKQAIDRINGLPQRPDFILHTGDLTHLSGAEEFDTLAELLKSAKTPEIFFVPGEHDVTGDNGKLYRERFGKNSKGSGWHSFDRHGVHFIGLVNVIDIQQNGLGALGDEQLKWLEDDLNGRSSETPIVVFAHIPLWEVYPQWGWGTKDGAKALNYLKRFGSVTVLNGHIHQAMKKVEGAVTFHTAMSTAFPQPEPGKAPKPGPMKVEAGKLREFLGVTDVTYVEGKASLAIVDSTLV
jgi:3',5'-cyclic-AMP phosphodiesterase